MTVLEFDSKYIIFNFIQIISYILYIMNYNILLLSTSTLKIYLEVQYFVQFTN